MNKACIKCGKIMLVPDIPLPRNYKQKCTACEYMNPVGEELYYEENPSERPEDSIDLFDFDDRYVDPLDLSRGGISRDNAEEWMEKIKSQPLPLEDSGSSPATLEDPFVPPTPQAEEEFLPEPSAPSVDQPQKSEQGDKEDFSELFDSLRKERLAVLERLDQMERELQALTAELERVRKRPEPTPQASKPPAAPGADAPVQPPRVAEGEVLMCSRDSALIATCEKKLGDLGFQVNAATNHELAQKRIQEYAYQVILFDQKFIAATKNGQSVLASVRKIALPVRRHQTVVMITAGIPTGESQIFYQWGIDLNVHSDDLPELGGLIRDLIDLKSKLLAAYLNSDLDTDSIIV